MKQKKISQIKSVVFHKKNRYNGEQNQKSDWEKQKMNFLEERILKDGIIKEGNVLKVDSFLNHQMDIDLFNEIGREFKKRFEGKKINKIL